MAVPTFVSVSPTTGPAAGGNLVTITGTNFRLPTPVYANPVVPIMPSVRVTVNGRTARQVDVRSTGSLRVLMPRYWHQASSLAVDTFPAVSIVITNLDANGVPIAGETVTATGAYTYARWDLGAPKRDPALYRIAKELIYALKLEVDRYTHMTTYIEYGELGSATVIKDAQLPSINLVVSTPKDIEYSQNDNTPEEIVQLDGSFKRYEGARTHMLDIMLYLTGAGTREALSLVSAVEEFIQVNPELLVSADPDLYPGQEDSYPIEITRDAFVVTSPNDSSIVTYSMQIRVRGIAVLPGEPTEIAKSIASFLLAYGDFTADDPSEFAF
jgi:hypothetical protein